jgi:hypothetical protein
VSNAGDVNNDGYENIIIGAPGTDEAYVYYHNLTYANSNTDTKGFTVNFSNAQSAFDGGVYANLSEENTSSGGGGGGVVDSVEKYTLSFGTSDTSVSANIQNSQDTSKCVPFVTAARGTTNDYWSMAVAEITFAASPDRIVATRDASGDVLNLNVTVVEFNSTKVKVQSGTFNINSASSDTDTISTAVTVANTGLVFYWQSSDSGDDYDDNSVRGQITSTTQVTFTRATSVASRVSGTWWVFEALDSDFSTQFATITLSGTETSDTATISSVSTDKTFLIASHTSNNCFTYIKYSR